MTSDVRRTKIVCTLGPASNDPETVSALIDAGMNVARLNFSHGTHAEHRRLLRTVRRCAEQKGQPIAVLQDLQGPKIRVGTLPTGSRQLLVGAEVTIACRTPTAGQIPCTYEALAADLADATSRRLLLDDGRMELEVLEVDAAAATVRCRVVVGGELTNNKGINLPGVTLSTPALTTKDREDLQLGNELGVDFFALSFVRSADDCKQARALMGNVPLIAKIEKPEAVENVDEILDVVDGLMVARGDLGVEIGPERVPMVQKTLIERTNGRGQLVITATEMLDSMRHSPRPTRAEASDVANAILDGTDAVMLSGETASGDYPVAAVETMDRIVRQTERSPRFRQADRPPLGFAEVTHAIARAAAAAAEEIKAETIICFTESGVSARLTSEYRPRARILAVTPRPSVYRQLALHWGVTPLLLSHDPMTAEETVEAVSKLAREAGFVEPGAEVVVTLGGREDGTSDLMKIHRV